MRMKSPDTTVSALPLRTKNELSGKIIAASLSEGLIKLPLFIIIFHSADMGVI
ncbi:hypothetical protein [Rhizobium sp. TRM95796]|uniref:hypothetical protein n=1 Tax=Rhizobium sp. TRM95796 TaxID=2979862 RepID=UPI0021E979EB|nr:hypothetical protein [Rhizobium sp. TRM95796]MCV3764099.1 hypothetical protein [Rhizobium sp. TRM95796]